MSSVQASGQSFDFAGNDPKASVSLTGTYAWFVLIALPITAPECDGWLLSTLRLLIQLWGQLPKGGKVYGCSVQPGRGTMFRLMQQKPCCSGQQVSGSWRALLRMECNGVA